MYNAAANDKFFFEPIDRETFRGVTELRVSGNLLLATYDRASFALWDLASKDLLKVLNLGPRCMTKINASSSGLEVLTIRRKGFSKTLTRHCFEPNRSEKFLPKQIFLLERHILEQKFFSGQRGP